MKKEIRTRKVQKNIRTLDKGEAVAEHLKNAYVRTKGSMGRTQWDQENDHTGSVQYAENKIAGASGQAVRKSIRQAGKVAPFLSAGVGRAPQPLKEEAVRRLMYRKMQERAKRSRGQTGWQDKAGRKEAGGSAGKIWDMQSQTGENVGKKDVKPAMKPGKTIKTSGQADTKVTGADGLIGVGMDITAGCHGAPALYRGALTGAVI